MLKIDGDSLKPEIHKAHSGTRERHAAMKDAHLVLLATQTGKVVFSLDDAARALFAQVPEAGGVMWANPCKDADLPHWIESNMPVRRHLQLRKRG